MTIRFLRIIAILVFLAACSGGSETSVVPGMPTTNHARSLSSSGAFTAGVQSQVSMPISIFDTCNNYNSIAGTLTGTLGTHEVVVSPGYSEAHIQWTFKFLSIDRQYYGNLATTFTVTQTVLSNGNFELKTVAETSTLQLFNSAGAPVTKVLALFHLSIDAVGNVSVTNITLTMCR
jgi:hypothetical protein